MSVAIGNNLVRRESVFVCVAALLVGALLAWDSRHGMSPDGLSYLEMGGGVSQRGLTSLVNGQWSPLYPGLIAAFLAVLRPSRAMEFPVVHFLNWTLFATAMLSFWWFLRTWCRRPTALWENFALLTCFWVLLRLNGVSAISPDLAVATLVFLAAGLVCKLSSANPLRASVLLGLTLAAAYYAKTSMFLVSLLLFPLLWIWSPGGAANRRRLLLASVVFLLACAPLVFLISQHLGRLSIGDSGKLNYVWHVNRYHTFVGWTGGDDPAHGVPAHPPRVLSSSPVILEFATPVPGTYPLWYDPSYWHEGLRVQVSVSQQARTFAENLWSYYYAALELIPLLAGWLALWLLQRREGTGAGQDTALRQEARWMVAWPVAICFVLALVHVESRYIAPYLVLLLLAGLWPRARVSSEAGRGVLTTVCLAIALSGLVLGLQAASRSAREWRAGKRPDNQIAAEWLIGLGLRRGDVIAMAGDSFDAYFAYLAGVRVGAQIRDAEAFLQLGTPELEQAKTLLAKQGIRAVVVRDGSARTMAGSGWRDGCGECAVKYRALILR